MNDIYGVKFFCRPYGTFPVFTTSIPSDESLGYFRMSIAELSGVYVPGTQVINCRERMHTELKAL